jgi:hypothetical protein
VIGRINSGLFFLVGGGTVEDKLAALEAEVEARAAQVRSSEDLEALRADILARKGGRLSRIMSGVG